MSKLKIGLDVDGVLADFIGAFRNEAGMVLQRQILGEPTDWEFTNWMNEDEQNKVWARVNRILNWWLSLQPLPGVDQNLRHLAEKHELYFVTTRKDKGEGEPVLRQTQRWLYRLAVPFPTVIVTEKKGPVAAALELDVFLDDKPENIEDVFQYSPLTQLFLQDASHNQGVHTMATRVSSFEEFISKL